MVSCNSQDDSRNIPQWLKTGSQPLGHCSSRHSAIANYIFLREGEKSKPQNV